MVLAFQNLKTDCFYGFRTFASWWTLSSVPLHLQQSACTLSRFFSAYCSQAYNLYFLLYTISSIDWTSSSWINFNDNRKHRLWISLISFTWCSKVPPSYLYSTFSLGLLQPTSSSTNAGNVFEYLSVISTNIRIFFAVLNPSFCPSFVYNQSLETQRLIQIQACTLVFVVRKKFIRGWECCRSRFFWVDVWFLC